MLNIADKVNEKVQAAHLHNQEAFLSFKHLVWKQRPRGRQGGSSQEGQLTAKPGSTSKYRVFPWLGPFPTHDWDLWIRTSGKKVPFWAFGLAPSAENVDKSQGKRKNNALGKMTVFGLFFCWPMDGHGVPKQESMFLVFHPLFPKFFLFFPRYVHYVSSLFFYPCLTLFQVFCFFFSSPLLSSSLSCLALPCLALPHTTHHTRTDTPLNTLTPPHGWLGT